ncbi:MAG: HAD hydrolase family protein, partial [Muribaculaceae bacterium]|nr:HAD hydrolase family protein [Muribaculaceae bacterium]
DVDGVLSPSTINLGADGAPVRMVNIKDGYALQLAVKKGYRISIITGADTPAIALRYNALGIKDVYLKASHKLPVLEQWMHDNGLTPEQVAYAGDDIPDFEPMKMVGLAVAPADAASDIKEIAGYVSPAAGGHGVARDLLEEILRANGQWMSHSEAFGW